MNSFLVNQPSSIQYLGDVSALSPFTGKHGLMDLRQEYYVAYAQDKWRVQPNLTINYGLRYEYYTAMHEAQNKDIVLDMTTGTLLDPGTQWYQTSPNNFGLRLGISYSRTNKTVFRVGAGLFYGPGQTEDQLQPAESDRINTTISSAIRPITQCPSNRLEL